MMAHELQTALISSVMQWAAWPIEGVTEREMQVLRLVSHGYTNQQIADALCIGERTVRTYVSRILDKTYCKNRTQLAVWAIRNKLFPEAE